MSLKKIFSVLPHILQHLCQKINIKRKDMSIKHLSVHYETWGIILHLYSGPNLILEAYPIHHATGENILTPGPQLVFGLC